MWKRNSILLFLAAMALYMLAANLDPFLHVWDERFHALVAKNMIDEPFAPMLYADPVVDMAYDRWDRAHIWLHKQPLFLWQMALSLKIFGIHEYAVRIPSAIMAALLVLLAYRLGWLYQNQRTGLIAAILVLSNPFLFELVSGSQGIEHNDVAFVFYISLSLWAFLEYYKSGSRKWIWAIGIFSGMAILCKWLVGLLVYLGWMLLRLQERKMSFKANKDFLGALLVTTLVALPWQIYTWLAFPLESAAEREYNLLHLFKPVEGHGGDSWYHLNNFGELYGTFALATFILAAIAAINKKEQRKLSIALVSMVAFVYLFFSLAATKMPAFPFVTMPLVYLIISSLLERLLSQMFSYWPNKKVVKVVFGLMLTGLFILHLNPSTLLAKHNMDLPENAYRKRMAENAAIFKSLDLPENAVVFNIPGRLYVECMFYTGVPAYGFMPTEEMCKDLVQKGRLIAVFGFKQEHLPPFLRDNPSVFTLPGRLVLIE
jgi:4-amino-4-deoxy-L-arabinose transferase